MDLTRYSRQLSLEEIGESGQRWIADSAVLIVGLGGLGAPAATYLTGAGVGRIGLCDPDNVSLSNLQRQVLYTEADVGMPKTLCAKRRLSAMSSHTVFETYPSGLCQNDAAELIRDYDIVIDCCDNFRTRYLIDDVCNKLGKPWIHGSIGAFHGQVAVMNSKRKIRYDMIYPDRDLLENRPAAAAGVIGVVPGVIGAIQAGEALKVIAGYGQPLDGRLFIINLKTLQSEILEF